MKSIISFFAAAILAVSSTPSANADAAVSVDFFYSQLDSYGSWRQVGDYGYCWHPDGVGDDWSPYSDGRWVYTDAGWTWDSEEPYGWAVYHYGRWANVGNVGWVWVPGTEWGPGWVSWRRSPQYVGWAPLPPEARFQISIGFNSGVDDYYDIGPGNYRFVEGRNFGARRLNSVFVDRRENLTIIHQTTNITKITYVNNVVHNGGMDYDQQSRVSTTPINRYKLDRRNKFEGDPAGQKAEQLKSRVSGDSMSVMAPTFSEKSSAAPAKTAVKVEKSQVKRGWENAGSPAEVAALRTKMKSKDAEPRDDPKKMDSTKEPKKDIKEDAESATEPKRPKEEKPSKAGTDNPARNADKGGRQPVPEKTEESNKPKRPPSADPTRENPKNVDKNGKTEPRRPVAEDSPKPKTERKPEVKNPDPQPKNGNGKGPGVKDKNRDPNEEAPEQ